MPGNILLTSLKESFSSIWRNKSLFLLLFLLQIVFLSVFSVINYSYQKIMLEKAKAITDYLSQQKLDDSSVASNVLGKKSILGDDPLSISRNFNDILKNFRLYLLNIFILLVVFISAIWAATNKVAGKSPLKNNFSGFMSHFLKIFMISFFYLGLVFLLLFSLINISFAQIAGEGAAEIPGFLVKYTVFIVISAVLAYFMFVSISLLHRTELKNIVQKTLVIGIKKAHYILAVYLINISLFGFSVFLLLHFIEENLFFLLLPLMVFSFVFGRIFMINVVDKID